jgi:undecaprenyl pyrophosphate synthase
MITTIYIRDVATELGYKDRRSIYRWCFNHGIKIMSDIGSNRKYIIKEEFEAIKMKQSVEYIKEKYGVDKLSEDFNSLIMTFFFKNNNAENTVKYRPVGEHERNFLKNLQNLNSTL